MTEKAIGFFQSKNDLEIDGEVGGQTWAALLGNWG
jgi:peptidoglycan hydrolase-like protein with peptidoglycan-binding domain